MAKVINCTWCSQRYMCCFAFFCVLTPVHETDMIFMLYFDSGLEHLHSLVPSFLHMHFRTSNVLVDENFTAKVSDFGLSRLLADGARAGSSSAIDCFLDPEYVLSL